MQNFLSGKSREKFEAMQHFLIPRSKKFTLAQKDESVRIINEFLADKPESIAFKLKLFFVFIDVVSILLCLNVFSGLSEQQKEKIMHLFFDSKVALFRKGFWGLNTLAKMGVYSQTSVYKDLGYQLKEITGER